MSIIGNTVGAPNPRPDWNQNDSKKADYIKNKPTELLENADAHLNNKSNPHGVTAEQIGAAPAGSVWTATDPNNDGNIVLQYGGIFEGDGGTGGTVPGGGSSGGGLTAKEVQAMIDAALAAEDELTEAEVQAMIDAALAAEDELTEEEVQTMIDASLGAIANGSY